MKSQENTDMEITWKEVTESDHLPPYFIRENFEEVRGFAYEGAVIFVGKKDGLWESFWATPKKSTLHKLTKGNDFVDVAVESIKIYSGSILKRIGFKGTPNPYYQPYFHQWVHQSNAKKF